MADEKPWRAQMPSGGWSDDLTGPPRIVCDGDETRVLVERINAERDAAEAREAAKDARIAELEYASGYAADLACIDRVLDEVGAPHDCEDGVSLSPKRIRLMAERIAELEASNARLRKRAALSLRNQAEEFDFLNPSSKGVRERRDRIVRLLRHWADAIEAGRVL